MSKCYYSYEEIRYQNKSLKRTLEYVLGNGEEIKDFFKSASDVVFVASGSSYWMSLSAHKTMHLFTGKKTFAVKAADVLMCPEEYVRLYDNPVFLCPSRSGQTREVLDALDILEKAYPDTKIFSVTEYLNNKLFHRSDLALSIEWANETSVCQTRSFSNLYTAFLVVAAIIGDNDKFIEQLSDYFDKATDLYTKHEKIINAIASQEKLSSLVTLGAGSQYGVVIAGAYIVIEMAEFVSSYFQLLEYRHGPVVTVSNETAVFICSYENADEFESKLADEIRKEGGRVYSVSNSDMSWADITFSLNGDYANEIVALHFIFVMQLFAHYFSIARGKNPDYPGNLVPFITY